MRDCRCRKSPEQIERELTGNWREDHLVNLSICLGMYRSITKRIEEVEHHVEQLLDRMRASDDPAPIRKAKAKNMIKHGEEPPRQALYRMAGVNLTRIDAIGVETAQTIQLGCQVIPVMQETKP